MPYPIGTSILAPMAFDLGPYRLLILDPPLIPTEILLTSYT